MANEFVKGFQSDSDKFSKKLKIEDLIDSENIAEELSEQDLVRIGMDLSQAFKVDEDSRAEWLEVMGDHLELALQAKEEKTFPFTNSANVKLPTLTIAALNFHARSFPAIVNNQNLVKYKVIGYDPTGEKTKRGARVARHMTYQLTEEMDEWIEEMDVALLVLPIVGCVFKKTYYDGVEGRCRSDLIFPQDVVVNYGVRRMEDAQRVHHIIWRSANEIIENINRGLYRDVDLAGGTKREPSEGDEIVGTTPTESDNDHFYKLVESHCFLDLDGDGYKEPYIVLWDTDSQKVLRITARYEERMIERTDDGKLVKITPITYFTKYGFIPNPSGKFYDLGWGLLLGPLNEVANSLTNQLLDAGTKAVANSGFIAKGLRPKGGDLTIEPNTYYDVNNTGDDIRKGIYTLDAPQPSPVLFQLLQLMTTNAQQVSSTGEIMSGESPGQNQPFGTSQMVLEEGTKVLTAVHKRIHGAFKKELQKIFYLNSIYLKDPDYQMILDSPEEVTTKADYDLSNLDISPASDPNIASKTQRMALARDLMDLSRQGTPMNPNVALKMYLEAMDVDNIQEVLNVPPPQPDPAVELEREKFEHQKEIDIAYAQIEILKVQGNYMRDQAAAIAKIMEAEALEPGQQFQEALQHYQNLQDQEKLINERVSIIAKHVADMAKIKAQQEQSNAQQGGAS